LSRFVGVLLGAFFPPVGVWMVVGFGMPFWLNLLLTLLFYVPGQIHGLWVVAHTRGDGSPAPDGTTAFIALLLAFFLPPVGVAFKRGIGLALLVNVLLTAFFWFPGSIHAVWVITED
jgi:uncharacterized membrane protein YqaE (UPF0057 family)